MNWNKDFLTILLGIISGVCGGALGQSGAEIMLPGLLILGIVSDFKTAAGTVLLTILPPISLLAIFEYYRRNEVNLKVGVILMICYFGAAYFGAYMTQTLSNATLEYSASIYFGLIGLFFLWNAYTGTFGAASKNKQQPAIGVSAAKNVFKVTNNKDK
jgi:uncharacterized membrane protein YfcA